MKNDADLALRIPKKLMDAIKKEADAICGSVSTIVRLALLDYLKSKGHALAPTDTPTDAPDAPPPARARRELAQRASARATKRADRG